jgi:hypothetical protein
MTSSFFRSSEYFDWSDVENPITDDEVREWLVNLRSGNFEQAKSNLFSDGNYCCLGVLAEQCDLFGEVAGGKSRGTMLCNIDINSDDESKNSPINYKLVGEIQDMLAQMNDNGYSFTNIAEVIEAGFFGDKDSDETKDVLEKYAFVF